MATSSTLTYNDLVALVRAEIKDQSESSFSATEIDPLIQRALAILSRDTEYLRMARGIVHAAGNPDVEISQPVVRVYAAWWGQQPLPLVHSRSLHPSQWVLFGKSSSSRPLYLIYFEDRKELKLWPVPSAGPPETTLSVAITGTGMQDVSVASASIADGSAGRIRIRAEGSNQEEQLEFHGIQTDTTPNKFLGCSRGVGGTVAGPHSSGAAVDYLPLVAFFSHVHPRITGTEPWQFPDDFRELFILKAAQLLNRIRRRYAEAEIYRREYEAALGPYRQHNLRMVGEGVVILDQESQNDTMMFQPGI